MIPTSGHKYMRLEPWALEATFALDAPRLYMPHAPDKRPDSKDYGHR